MNSLEPDLRVSIQYWKSGKVNRLAIDHLIAIVIAILSKKLLNV